MGTGNGNYSTRRTRGQFQTACAYPIFLMPAARNRATEAFPLWLAPRDAHIVAVGRHAFLPMAAVAWISDGNEIVVCLEAEERETGRSVLVRVWSRDGGAMSRTAEFSAQSGRATAMAVMGAWNLQPIAGVIFVSLTRPEETCAIVGANQNNLADAERCEPGAFLSHNGSVFTEADSTSGRASQLALAKCEYESCLTEV